MNLTLAAGCLTVLLVTGCVSSGSQYSSPASKPRPSKTYAEITKGINAVVANDTVSASYNFQAANQIMNNTVANHPDDYYWNHWYLDHAYAKALLAQSYLERGMALSARSLFLEIPDVIRTGQSQYGNRVQERNNTQ